MKKQRKMRKEREEKEKLNSKRKKKKKISWRPAASLLHSLTGPVVQQFASSQGGQQFAS
jgi:hypothetical protein